MLTPQRRRGFEYLDDPHTSAAVRNRSMRDVRVSNMLFGGTRAVLAELEKLLPELRKDTTLLDVGTGLADIPLKARDLAARRAVQLTTIGLDESMVLAHQSLAHLTAALCADARNLPFSDHSIDILTCSQVLHHFDDSEVQGVIAELNRVARVAVIVSDLRRSWIAASGFWLASWPLNFHAVTRHDGMTSVMRGFTAAELSSSIEAATGQRASVRRHLGYRITATWSPRT